MADRGKEVRDALTRVTGKHGMHALKVWARMIKLEHSLFALPYAFLGAFLAAGGMPPLWPLLWLTVAMVGIRSFAMTLNRLADIEFDRLNPRTSKRALVTGEISVPAARVFAFLSILVYFVGCIFLNRLAFILSPVPVLVIIAYSFAKRYTWTTHFILGLCHAFAPMAGWISVNPHIALTPALFSCSLIFWTAGFDMIYSCQDADFDVAVGLHSAPAKFGTTFSLVLASFSHVVFALFLGMAFWSAYLGWIGFGAWLVVAGLLVGEHRLVKPQDLRQVNTAFFTLNAVIAAVIFAGTVLALFVN